MSVAILLDVFQRLGSEPGVSSDSAEDLAHQAFSDLFESLEEDHGLKKAEFRVDEDVPAAVLAPTSYSDDLFVSTARANDHPSDTALRFDQLGVFGHGMRPDLAAVSGTKGAEETSDVLLNVDTGLESFEDPFVPEADGVHANRPRNIKLQSPGFVQNSGIGRVGTNRAGHAQAAKADTSHLNNISTEAADLGVQTDGADGAETRETVRLDATRLNEFIRQSNGASLPVWVSVHGAQDALRLIVRITGDQDLSEADLRREIARLLQDQGIRASDIIIGGTSLPSKNASKGQRG